jgi:hypothetical protein
MIQELALNGLRFVLILVYVGAVVAIIVQRAPLAEAALPGVLGFGALGIASIISAVSVYMQLTVVAHHELLRSIAPILGILSYVAQALAIVGTVLVAAAVLVGRAQDGP